MAIQMSISPESWFTDSVKNHIGHRFHNHDLGIFEVRTASAIFDKDPLLCRPKAISVVGAKGAMHTRSGDFEMTVEDVIFSPRHGRNTTRPIDPPWVLYLSEKKKNGAEEAVLATKGMSFFIELTDHPTGHCI